MQRSPTSRTPAGPPTAQTSVQSTLEIRSISYYVAVAARPAVNNNNNNILTVKSCREILGDDLGDTSFVHGLMKFSLFSHASFLWNLFGL